MECIIYQVVEGFGYTRFGAVELNNPFVQVFETEEPALVAYADSSRRDAMRKAWEVETHDGRIGFEKSYVVRLEAVHDVFYDDGDGVGEWCADYADVEAEAVYGMAEHVEDTAERDEG